MITFKGIHASIYKLGVKIKRWRMVPASSDTYANIPGRHGSYHYPGKRQDLLIELEFGFVGTNREKLYSKMLDISAWLYSEERDTLSFDILPGKYLVGKPEGEIDMEPAFTLGTFETAFRCEPFIYGEEQQENIAGVINNPGTSETPPIFVATFTAAATEWKVTLGTQYIRVVHNFSAGDTLEVNCDTGSVLINGANAMTKLDWQNSQFFSLPPGESTLSVLPAGVSNTTVTLTPRWL